MSSEEIRVVAGLKSDAVRERLPGAALHVIHRDDFVLADPPGADSGVGGHGLMQRQ
jgi:hypothetical protein